MLPVVILSDRPQTALLSRVAFALERSAAESYVLREHTGRSELALNRGILVIRDLKTPNRSVRFGENVVAVIESACHAAVRLVGRHSLRTVCCGMSPRDTLIAESIDDGRGLLCLQRSIPTVFGEREPCELVVRTDSSCDASSLLLTAGALLAAGVDENAEIVI